MKFTKEQVLCHIDAIIDRQQQNLDELASDKPKPISQLEKARNKLKLLREFRKNFILESDYSQSMLSTITKDMQELGWQ